MTRAGAVITIRPATAGDETALGRFGAAIMRQHHAADPKRFIQTEHPETGYGRFLVSRIGDAGNLILVAEQSGRIVGYVFAADIDETNWMELRGPCGAIHDLYVDEAARHQGAGRQLMQAAIEWIHSLGRSQVVLMAMTGNEHAQSLFSSLGFRATMVEMVRDRDA